MPVRDAEHPQGIRASTLWLLQEDHVHSYFRYAESGHASHLEKTLRGDRLASVMCNGSATDSCVERASGDRGGCNAHARRKLVEALRGGDQRAARRSAHARAAAEAHVVSPRPLMALTNNEAERELRTSGPRP